MFNPIWVLLMLRKYFVAWCLCFLLFFLIIGRHFVSSHNLKEKPTNNIPVGQSDLKTAKSVFLSLRPSKLSKLQCCWTTAEERMAPPHTAAWEAKLIAEIFRKPVQFKGAVEDGSFHACCAAVSFKDCVFCFFFAAFWPASSSKPRYTPA